MFREFVKYQRNLDEVALRVNMTGMDRATYNICYVSDGKQYAKNLQMILAHKAERKKYAAEHHGAQMPPEAQDPESYRARQELLDHSVTKLLDLAGDEQRVRGGEKAKITPAIRDNLQ